MWSGVGVISRMVHFGGCSRRWMQTEVRPDTQREKRVLRVSIGSSGGELEAGRHEGTRGVPEEGVGVGEGRGEGGWTVGL